MAAHGETRQGRGHRKTAPVRTQPDRAESDSLRVARPLLVRGPVAERKQPRSNSNLTTSTPSSFLLNNATVTVTGSTQIRNGPLADAHRDDSAQGQTGSSRR